jgi:hypothetical protein
LGECRDNLFPYCVKQSGGWEVAGCLRQGVEGQVAVVQWGCYRTGHVRDGLQCKP